MNRRTDIAIATAAILIVCLFMAMTSGCKDKAEACDAPIAIGGPEGTMCDQDDHCRVEHDGNGGSTVYTCIIHRCIQEGEWSAPSNAVGVPYSDLESVQRLLTESISTNSLLLVQRTTLQDELLKANTEIVTCWKIIEDAKPDPNAPPVWGNGDPPATWTETFGNDNGARMDFVQMRMLSEQAARIKRLEEFCRIGGGQ